jgi:branched-subunit amino acid transport protein
MNEWLLIGGMALVTFLIRYSLLAFSGKLQIPPAAMKALSFVPPVVLTAIVVPAVLMPDGKSLWLGWDNARLVGALACIATGVWRQNLLLTIVVGMAVFLGWQWAIGS